MLGANLPPQLRPLAAVIVTSSRAGGILIGAFVSVFLCGIVVAQAAAYFVTFRSDRGVFKAAVAALTFLNVAQTAVTIAWQYTSLIANYSDIQTAFLDVTFLMSALWLFLSTTASIVQVFYAYRVFVLLQRTLFAKVAVSIILFASLVGFGSGWAVAILNAKIGNGPPGTPIAQSPIVEIDWLFSLSYACPIAADMTISCCMLYGLHRVNKLLLPSDTVKAISKALFLLVESNALTSCFSVGVIAAFVSNQRPISIALAMVLCKLYQLTLVNSLLARDSDRHRLFGASGSLSTETTSRRTGSAGVKLSTFDPRTTGVHVTTHTLSKADVDDDALNLGVKHKSAYWIDSDTVRVFLPTKLTRQAPTPSYGQ